jgi:hypothetical protein
MWKTEVGNMLRNVKAVYAKTGDPMPKFLGISVEAAEEVLTMENEIENLRDEVRTVRAVLKGHQDREKKRKGIMDAVEAVQAETIAMLKPAEKPSVSSVEYFEDTEGAFEETIGKGKPLVIRLGDKSAEEQLKNLSSYYGEPVMPLSKVCAGLRKWGEAMTRVEGDGEAGTYRSLGTQVLGALGHATKSNLLFRILYLGEDPRTEKCPVHKGVWSGCEPDGKCECMSGSNVTGWLPNERGTPVTESVSPTEAALKLACRLRGVEDSLPSLQGPWCSHVRQRCGVAGWHGHCVFLSRRL